MHCEHSLERGKRNPKRLAGVLANEKPVPGCSCIAVNQWRPGRSQQGRALLQRVVVVSEQQNPEGSSHTAERESKDFGKKRYEPLGRLRGQLSRVTSVNACLNESHAAEIFP